VLVQAGCPLCKDGLVKRLLVSVNVAVQARAMAGSNLFAGYFLYSPKTVDFCSVVSGTSTLLQDYIMNVYEGIVSLQTDNTEQKPTKIYRRIQGIQDRSLRLDLLECNPAKRNWDLLAYA
jgi:hypothetical protein